MPSGIKGSALKLQKFLGRYIKHTSFCEFRSYTFFPGVESPAALQAN